MDTHLLDETFESSSFDSRLRWFNPPSRWRLDRPGLAVEPDPKTDFWQRTHYGFQADNGHFLYLEVPGDFVLTTRVRFRPASQYDQAGLMVRLSPHCWLKTSVEYEPHGPSRLGAVVTNAGYSDWSTQDYPSQHQEILLRVRREGSDYIVEAAWPPDSTAPAVQPDWSQLRLAHLHDDDGATVVQAGLYACSPTAGGYTATFAYLHLAEGRLP